MSQSKFKPIPLERLMDMEIDLIEDGHVSGRIKVRELLELIKGGACEQ